MSSPMPHLSALLHRFARDERGVFAVLFGLMAIVLVAMGGAVVDYVSLEQTRNRAQLALDAATLALQPEITERYYDEDDIVRRAEALMIKQIGNSDIRADIQVIAVDQTRGSLLLSGDFTIQTAFVRLVGVNSLSGIITSEAVRGSLDIEVAVALDITGSMSGTRIRDLKTAASSFIQTMVQDDQSQNYSRVALIPYSQAVNVSPFQDQIRGPVRGYKTATTMDWAKGSDRWGAADLGYGVVTIRFNKHGYANGDWVYVWNDSSGVINYRAFQVTNVSNNSFQLVGTNERYRNPYSTNVQFIDCLRANCEVRVSSNNHGFKDGEYIHITNVGDGLTGLNNNTYQVRDADRDSLILSGSAAAGRTPDRRSYTSNSGRLHCTWQTTADTCTYYRYANLDGGWSTRALSTCVTERPTNAATDNPFTQTFAGRNYPASNNPCVRNPVVPLTDDKASLLNAINSFEVEGSTAGELGIVWAWHMLSPHLGYLWPQTKNRPAAYDEPNVFKAAVIMTDGDFNTVHCNGVVARNSTGGGASGSNSDKINCNSPNGDAYQQARAYCDAMKKDDQIVVFTVGFGISKGSEADKLLTYCASGASNAFLTNNGSQLNAAFQQIAENISPLRIAR